MSNNKQTLFIVALLCSLAFNIFLGGLSAGHHLARGRFMDHPPPPGGPPGPLGRGPFEPGLGIVRVLPKATQAKIAPLVQKQKGLIRSQHQHMKDAQRAVFDKLVADDFNSQAFLDALTNLQGEGNKMQNMMGQFLAEVASVLNAEERQQLAKAMRRGPPPPPFEGGPPPPPPHDDME